MWRCQVCGSDNREKDDYETFVRIVCRDCGAIHDYELREVVKIDGDGGEMPFDWHHKAVKE